MAVQRSSAAARDAVPQKLPRPQVRRPVKPHLVPEFKTGNQSSMLSILRIARVAVVAVCVFAMCAILTVQRTKVMELSVSIGRQQELLEQAKAETVRLDTQLNNLASVKSVEEYARDRLGMVKGSDYQLRVFASDNTDEIEILSGLHR